MSKADEVAWGKSQEVQILAQWSKVSEYAREVAQWKKGVEFADYDFVGWSKSHIPFLFVEVKERRSEWGRFGDVIFPLRKHRFAKRLASFNIPLIGVTRYCCGTLVEVNLQDEPSEVVMISRKDRPGQAPVRHVRYEGDTLVVYAK